MILLSRRDRTESGQGLTLSLVDGDSYYITIANGIDRMVKANPVRAKWNHVALTKQESVWKIYSNGVPVTEPKTGWVCDHSAEKAVPLWLGSDHFENAPFKGILDEIRIYDRALSDEEITELSQAERDATGDDSDN